MSSKPVPTWAAAILVIAAASAASAQTRPGPARPAQPQPVAQQSRPAEIDRAGVLILTRSVLSALDQANRTGNYTVLRDLGGPAFQANNAARLAEVFADLRREKVDLLPTLVLEPVLTLAPRIEANGLMRLAGWFPTNPRQINFEIAWQPVNGEWRLYGVVVATSAPSPTPGAPRPQ